MTIAKFSPAKSVKKRGRPRKINDSSLSSANEQTILKKRRGRPPKYIDFVLPRNTPAQFNPHLLHEKHWNNISKFNSDKDFLKYAVQCAKEEQKKWTGSYKDKISNIDSILEELEKLKNDDYSGSGWNIRSLSTRKQYIDCCIAEYDIFRNLRMRITQNHVSNCKHIAAERRKRQLIDSGLFDSCDIKNIQTVMHKVNIAQSKETLVDESTWRTSLFNKEQYIELFKVYEIPCPFEESNHTHNEPTVQLGIGRHTKQLSRIIRPGSTL
jgi:hypothetical protein